MKALIIGLILIAAAVAACLPQGLEWWNNVKDFLRGCLPVLAVIIGLVAILIGIADMKDRADAKKDKIEESQN